MKIQVMMHNCVIMHKDESLAVRFVFFLCDHKNLK